MAIAPFDAHPERLAGGAGRIGRAIVESDAMAALNMRSAHRAVAGGGPGPEGNVTKLVLSEIGHEAAAIMAALGGPRPPTPRGGAMTATMVLMHRAMSIAGGTSEIKRNQIGERILGLPRDPLINCRRYPEREEGRGEREGEGGTMQDERGGEGEREGGGVRGREGRRGDGEGEEETVQGEGREGGG